jgi:hypothetical protein
MFGRKRSSAGALLQNIQNQGKMLLFERFLKRYNVYLQQYCNL